MRFIFPILLILIAAGIFFVFTDPLLNDAIFIDATTGNIAGGVFPLLKERGDLNTALSNSAKLQDASRALVDRYNTLSEEERRDVDKLLPDHIDNVQLIIDINSIADKYGMTIKNIKIQTDDTSANPSSSGRTATTRRQAATATQVEKVALLSFTVTGGYNQLRNFLTDLSRSLRLVDVTGLSFTASDQDLYQFNIELKTYWLE